MPRLSQIRARLTLAPARTSAQPIIMRGGSTRAIAGPRPYAGTQEHVFITQQLAGRLYMRFTGQQHCASCRWCAAFCSSSFLSPSLTLPPCVCPHAVTRTHVHHLSLILSSHLRPSLSHLSSAKPARGYKILALAASLSILLHMRSTPLPLRTT